MAKAINWPAQFRDEVINEDSEQLRCALRLGDLYYQHRYWVPDEVVDVRVDHKKIRKAVIVGDLRQCPLKALTSDDLNRLKTGLSHHEAVRDFLAAAYNQPVDGDTSVTVVTYRNQPVISEDMDVQDDPHMA